MSRGWEGAQGTDDAEDEEAETDLDQCVALQSANGSPCRFEADLG